MTERCRSVEPLLSAWLDRSLSRPERAAVSAHLPRCERCRSELASLRRAVALVRSAPTRCLPDDVRTTLLATAGVPAYVSPAPARMSVPRAAATVLALLMMLGVSAWLLDEQAPGPQFPAPADVYLIDGPDPVPSPVFVDSE